jgi:hypothetical protein
MLSFIFWFLFMRDVPDPRTWLKDKGKKLRFSVAIPVCFHGVAGMLVCCFFEIFFRNLGASL